MLTMSHVLCVMFLCVLLEVFVLFSKWWRMYCNSFVRFVILSLVLFVICLLFIVKDFIMVKSCYLYCLVILEMVSAVVSRKLEDVYSSGTTGPCSYFLSESVVQYG